MADRTGEGSRGPGVGNGEAGAVLFAREGAGPKCSKQLIPHFRFER